MLCTRTRGNVWRVALEDGAVTPDALDGTLKRFHLVTFHIQLQVIYAGSRETFIDADHLDRFLAACADGAGFPLAAAKAMGSSFR